MLIFYLDNDNFIKKNKRFAYYGTHRLNGDKLWTQLVNKVQ